MNRTQADRLAHAFRQQVEFARTYAPLYARIFGTLAAWLGAPGPDPLLDWLLAAGRSRRSFAVTNLLAAGLHREVLAGRAPALARYYPTAGGTVAPGPDFPDELRQAIWAARDRLTPFIQNANVQTNETSRGLIWLLPFCALPWPAAHLVDMGASAGLNLAAAARAFALVDDDGAERLRLGAAGPVEISSRVEGDVAALAAYPGGSGPQILSRIGGDVQPFHLHDAEDELTLMSFIWADQPERLARLRGALGARARINQGPAPIRLAPLSLPEDLPVFIQTHIPADDIPLVLYNTYVKVYLPDAGAGLAARVAQVAAAANRPVLWCQLEPAPGAPATGWCAWTVDLWRAGRWQQWQLAWAHPHLTDIHFLPGFAAWTAAWSG